MYSRSVLAVLGLTLLSGFTYKLNSNFEGGDSSVSSFAAAVPSFEVPPSKDVAKDVTSRVDSLPAVLAKISSPQGKIEKIRETLAWIEAARKSSGVQSMTREMNMDFMTQPLKDFVVSEFRQDNCAYYKDYLNTQFEPSEDGEVSHPALKRAQRVIASVCK